MRKKLLIFSLVLSLLVVLFAPGTAVARSERGMPKYQPQAFHAEAGVWVTDPGTSTQYGLTIMTWGEKAEGVFAVSNGWESMVGATLKVHHNSAIRLDPANGTFAGRAWATITVTFPGDSQRLYGTYSASLSGNFMMHGEQLVILSVIDDGEFRVAGRDGRGLVMASGDWLGNLTFNGATLEGTAIVDGQYYTMGSK